MELCPFGSVRDLMAAAGVETLREVQAGWVMQCALEGLDQLHSSEVRVYACISPISPKRPLRPLQPRIIHLDIKGTNLMVAEEGDIKIADFGLARQVRSPHFSYEAPSSPAAQLFRSTTPPQHNMNAQHHADRRVFIAGEAGSGNPVCAPFSASCTV